MIKKNALAAVLGLLGLFLCLLLVSSAALAVGVVDTLHNLSASGTGPISTASEERVCIFCHTPHHANVTGDYMPLWSRALSTADYTLYSSTTVQAAPDQPTGASRLCLSCHDGTIAVGLLTGDYRPGGNSLGALPVGDTNLETDLSNDHPISFVYEDSQADDGQMVHPDSLTGAVQLSPGNRMECTACHDSHQDLFGKFLLMDNGDSALCEVCHIPTGWADGTHNRNDIDVSCESCHTAHGAGHAASLLRSTLPDEEDACLISCHNAASSGPEADVETAFSRTSTHPLDFTDGIHDPTETPLTMAEHVECADCHNSHQLDGAIASAPNVSGRLSAVSGVDASGVEIESASYEYEICYKCHSSNPFVDATHITRQFNELDESIRFDAGNPSYHPVTALGKNTTMVTLTNGYTTGSRIYCTDCHNSSSGATGPHGSIYEPILVGQYLTSYPQSYAQSNYDLCWRCHDPAVLMPAPPADNIHTRHVQGLGAHAGKETPCASCHDPHGVPDVSGTYLINFDSTAAGPTMVHDQLNRTCSVDCHSSATARSY
ncbi:MAG: cytochrome C [Desulfuromonas sp.]|nr:MAG: cytochrome C [Desulfuromonas sp.]